MITVYVGDVDDYLATLCTSVDTKSKLITQENCTNLEAGTYYTSIADVGSLSNFAAVLRQANKIVYSPPKNWSDQRKGQSKMQQWCEDYLNVFRLTCKVENFISTWQGTCTRIILSIMRC